MPFAQGEELARGIAGAQFIALDSPNHILLADEAAWPMFTRELRAFLND